MGYKFLKLATSSVKVCENHFYYLVKHFFSEPNCYATTWSPKFFEESN